MKSGLTITQMAQELERQQNVKRDFVADTRQLIIAEDAGVSLALGDKGIERFDSNNIFRRQMAEHFKVPHDYAERLRDTPELRALYADTFNTHLQKMPTRQMIRTLDGTARAFRSDRFRPLDNFDLAEAVLPAALAQPQVSLVSSQFTEAHFYMKFVFPRLEAEVKKGDVVQFGISISNSEVGMGSLAVEPFTYRLICLNGMIAADYGHKRYHVGKKAEGGELAYELYSEGTRKLDDAALFAKIQDTVRGLLNRDVLERLVQPMRDATEQPLEGTNIVGAVEVVAKKLNYGEGTKQGVLKHLLMGNDLTRYGLMNAITRQSQDEGDYETATKLEKDGGRILELPKADWRQIADAALKAA